MKNSKLKFLNKGIINICQDLKFLTKTTMKNNVLIAEFMGLKPVEYLGVFSISKDHCTSSSKTAERAMKGFGKVAKYHNSWCWLMPVVQKCKGITLYKLRGRFMMDEIDCILVNDLDVGKLHKEVVAFIEYYNMANVCFIS